MNIGEEIRTLQVEPVQWPQPQPQTQPEKVETEQPIPAEKE